MAEQEIVFDRFLEPVKLLGCLLVIWGRPVVGGIGARFQRLSRYRGPTRKVILRRVGIRVRRASQAGRWLIPSSVTPEGMGERARGSYARSKVWRRWRSDIIRLLLFYDALDPLRSGLRRLVGAKRVGVRTKDSKRTRHRVVGDLAGRGAVKMAGLRRPEEKRDPLGGESRQKVVGAELEDIGRTGLADFGLESFYLLVVSFWQGHGRLIERLVLVVLGGRIHGNGE